jgi:uncharacterized integral membrane protein
MFVDVGFGEVKSRGRPDVIGFGGGDRMSSPYKRRRPSIVRNFWIYRRLVLLAVVLGLMLWFIWANSAPVTVAFPFRLGSFSSSAGLVILLSALVGSVVTALTMTMLFAMKRRHGFGFRHEHGDHPELDNDLPPADYASKTTEGLPESRWP